MTQANLDARLYLLRRNRSAVMVMLAKALREGHDVESVAHRGGYSRYGRRSDGSGHGGTESRARRGRRSGAGGGEERDPHPRRRRPDEARGRAIRRLPPGREQWAPPAAHAGWTPSSGRRIRRRDAISGEDRVRPGPSECVAARAPTAPRCILSRCPRFSPRSRRRLPFLSGLASPRLRLLLLPQPPRSRPPFQRQAHHPLSRLSRHRARLRSRQPLRRPSLPPLRHPARSRPPPSLNRMLPPNRGFCPLNPLHPSRQRDCGRALAPSADRSLTPRALRGRS